VKPTPAVGSVEHDSDIESLFLAHLATIDRICAMVCARQGVRGENADDFTAWARMRLMENDYAILRQFGGRASAATFLSVVVANLFRDHRIRERGRWRCSAVARRLGPHAERLERLVYAHGLAFSEAARTLRSETGDDISDRELAEIFAHLPVREPMRPQFEGDAGLLHVPTPASADAGLEAEAERHEREALRAGLGEALAMLPAEDRLILRMRYWDGVSVANIARDLRLEQKPLYRRIDLLLRRLRRHLVAAGVDPQAVLASIGADIHHAEVHGFGPSIDSA
jgi:RNA polymerase sigma factor (sigma-70 family)